MSSKPDFPKLKNETNYTLWATRAEAFFITKGLISGPEDMYAEELYDEDGE